MTGSATLDWASAFAFAAMGATAGTILLRRILRAGTTDGTAAALDRGARLDQLLAELRQLRDASAARRYEMELEAARALRDIERAAARSAASPPSSRPELRGFLWGSGSMAVLSALLYMNSGRSLPRPEPAADTASRLELAREALSQGDMMQVFEHTQRVLEREPGEPRALAYQAAVRAAMGQTELAIQMLKTSLAGDPGQSDARTLLEELEARKPAPAPAAHAAVPPPPARGAGPPVPAPATRGITGTVDLDAVLRAIAKPAVVFVTLRAAGTTSGGPLAVVKLTPASFPAAFRIGDSDSTTLDALPSTLRVEARMDADGDAITRSPQDLSAAVDRVSPGATGIRLVLRSAGAR